MNTTEIEEAFLKSFIITNDKQTYLSYPCHISEFQKECILEILIEVANQIRQEAVDEYKTLLKAHLWKQWDEMDMGLYRNGYEDAIVEIESYYLLIK